VSQARPAAATVMFDGGDRFNLRPPDTPIWTFFS
jgi:hypothetical protein